jgi:hypothetical protein
MTQNPQTPSGTSSFDEPDPMMTSSTAYDDSTSFTSTPPAGTASASVVTGTTTTSTGGQSQTGKGTSKAVRDEAASVGADAAEGGRRVADTAASEVKDIVGEARSQLSALLEQLRGEVSHQASGQSDRAVTGLRSLSNELSQMASSSQQNGIATDLAGQAASRVQTLAGWLEQRQPAEVLDEVRDFARRRPGTFLTAAAVIGLIGGRLTRGLTAGSDTASTTSPVPASYAGAPAETLVTEVIVVDTGSDPAAHTYPRTAVDDVDGEGVEGAELREGLR